ncbi:Na+/H+ antiporter NhaC [Tissierella sp.]|uniref:Na+/H+ antiporter NhaC n=1 Tax=Tissierella sp. TaxID=41274 RepID=UPI0028B0E929|nr:Na+/H+ antiporter NhaC [Tissierella sp.]
MGTCEEKIQPSFGISLFTLISVILILVVGITVFKADIHALLLISLSFSCIVSFRLGYSFDNLMEGMERSLTEILPAMMIFILIGVIIGSWIMAGTVPAIIYYGLKILTPLWFLPVGLLLCSLTSIATGSSWGTVGTVGIALMGVGNGLGIPAHITAGMIVSGAYFGDKMSTISDTTNLAAAAAGTNLYEHVKSMSYTTTPAYIITLILYTLIGFKYSKGSVNKEEVDLIVNTLGTNFNMNPIIFLPMIVLFTLNIKRASAVPSMIIGAAAAVVIAIVFQKATINAALLSLNYGYSGNTGVEIVDKLLNRGGIQEMMWTFSLAFIAISLGGVLQQVGFLDRLIKGFIGNVNNPGILALIVISTTTLGIAAMGEVYLSIILNGNLYREEFKKKGLKPNMLSRLLEEGGTLMEIFIPWSTGGAFVAATLGVENFKIAPYALLSIINPILSIVFSFLGIYVLWESKPIKKIIRLKKKTV